MPPGLREETVAKGRYGSFRSVAENIRPFCHSEDFDGRIGNHDRPIHDYGHSMLILQSIDKLLIFCRCNTDQGMNSAWDFANNHKRQEIAR
jgi:hypothetical protein